MFACLLFAAWLVAFPDASAAAAVAPDSTVADRGRAREPAFPAADSRAWQTGLLRADRLQHASLSFTLAAGAGLATREPGASFALVLALGVAKELLDARSDRFDPLDLAADVLGAGLGTLAVRSGRL